MEANSWVRGRARATQKAPQGDDRNKCTHINHPSMMTIIITRSSGIVFTYLEDLGSNSALHFRHWGIGSKTYEATNESQRLKLSLRRKHALVKTPVFDRHSMECFLFDKRKTYRVSCTQTSCYLTAFGQVVYSTS